MRYLLVILLFVCNTSFASGAATGKFAWFAANWFSNKAQLDAQRAEVPLEKFVPTPVLTTDEKEMNQYVKLCAELTNDANMCRENWVDAKSNGDSMVLVPFERTPQVRKVDERQVTKTAKVEVTKYVVESKVKGVNLLDVDNTEYKERRASTMSKPNAVILHDTIR
jgi:hypothetical protein